MQAGLSRQPQRIFQGNMLALFLLLFPLHLPTTFASDRRWLNAKIDPSGEFEIFMGEERRPWFSSNGVMVRNNGVLYRTASNRREGEDSQVLELKSLEQTGPGWDALGAIEKEVSISYAAGSMPFVTKIRQYQEGFIVFEQVFPEGASNTSAQDHDKLISSFPTIKLHSEGGKGGAMAAGGDDDNRGFLAYAGHMVGSSYVTAPWKTARESLPGGIEGTGPLVVFTGEGASESPAAVVISPLTSFMSANQVVDPSPLSPSLGYGLMGSVTSVPRKYSVATIFFPSTHIHRAMQGWGDLLLKNGNNADKRKQSRTDFTVNYLAYSTDNGAYYYYLTEQNKTYQDTLIDIKRYAEAEGIPYRHWLMDSWWYFKGDKNGVKNWTAMPSIFPDGIDYVYNRTLWPIVAHNRYWSANTDYAKQNGGDFDFCVEHDGSQMAVPLEQRFWDFLLSDAKKWGLHTYEQDWLYNEFEGLQCILESATLGRQWLLQMASGAAKNSLTIQYCMSWPRHVLQSTEFSSVTQARASDDYHPGNDQWRIGVTSIFAHAVGLVPTKDNFWSMEGEVGRYGNDTEPFPALQAVVSTLSSGPVAPSDMIGESDVKLILRSVRADGLILRPDRPAMVIEAAIKRSAAASNPKQDNKPLGDIQVAHSVVSGLPYMQVLAVESPSYNLSLTAMFQAGGYDDVTPAIVEAFLCFETSGQDPLRNFQELDRRSSSSSSSLQLPAAPTKKDFSLWNVVPRIPSTSWVFLGEAVDKWVAVSGSRFSEIQANSEELSVVASGPPGEIVTAYARPADDLPVAKGRCEVPEAGAVKMIFDLDGGSSCGAI